LDKTLPYPGITVIALIAKNRIEILPSVVAQNSLERVLVRWTVRLSHKDP
jgi:hypothetical protein